MYIRIMRLPKDGKSDDWTYEEHVKLLTDFKVKYTSSGPVPCITFSEKIDIDIVVELNIIQEIFDDTLRGFDQIWIMFGNAVVWHRRVENLDVTSEALYQIAMDLYNTRLEAFNKDMEGLKDGGSEDKDRA